MDIAYFVDQSCWGLPLAPKVRAGLALSPHRFDELRALFRRVLYDIEPDLQARAGGWYGDQWIDRNLRHITDQLDTALERWRRLYRSARQFLSRATQAIEGGLHSLGSEEYRRYKRNQDQATRQLDLLLVFLRTADNSGESISRPRAIALREFGPMNIIYCEEEERISRGYDTRTYFSVDAGQPDQAQPLMGQRIRQAHARSTEGVLLNLRYIPAARLVHVNTKWRSQHNEGFPLGLVSGDWRSSIPKPDTSKESFRSVKLWTSNLADALHIEPIQPLGLDADGVVTLQYALKRAIELETQVEPNELGVISVGDPEAPNILLYEAAEGSLGILSRFVEDPGLYRRVVEQAIAFCRYDDPGPQGPASYDDLLSYYNQRDHKRIDRWLIRDPLEKLRLCNLEIQSNPAYDDYDRQYQALLKAIDPNSEMERKFLDYLYQHGLRLPDAAQKPVDGLYVRPDFYYAPRFWVFCDGTPHDRPEAREEDDAKRQAVLARGDEVWVWRYREELGEVVKDREDVFRRMK